MKNMGKNIASNDWNAGAAAARENEYEDYVLLYNIFTFATNA